MFAKNSQSKFIRNLYSISPLKRTFSVGKPLFNKQFHGKPSVLPNSFAKRIAALSVFSLTWACVYLDQHKELLERFYGEKEESEDKVTKRKIAKLNVLKHENIIPKKINFVFCEDLKAQKIDTLELLAKRTPPGFISFLINKYITTNISGDFDGSPVKSEFLYITNAQLMSLDEIFKFEIDYSIVNKLILKKENKDLNEDMIEYFDTVSKIVYI